MRMGRRLASEAEIRVPLFWVKKLIVSSQSIETVNMYHQYLQATYAGARIPREARDCLKLATVVSANGLSAALITVAFSLSSNPRPAISRDSVITAEEPSSSVSIRATVSSCRCVKSSDVCTPTMAMLNILRLRSSAAVRRISASSNGAMGVPLSAPEISFQASKSGDFIQNYILDHQTGTPWFPR